MTNAENSLIHVKKIIEIPILVKIIRKFLISLLHSHESIAIVGNWICSMTKSPKNKYLLQSSKNYSYMLG